MVFSLAYTDYLRREEYKSLYNREKRREKWECDNYIEGEQREMVELYMEKGLSRTDAEAVIKILSKDKGIFVEMMMMEELQMVQPEEPISSFKNSLLLFWATFNFGIIPLLPYAAQWFLKSTEWSIWLTHERIHIISQLFSLVSLFAIGAVKSGFTVTRWWHSGLQLFIHGTILLSVCHYSISFIPHFL